MAVGLIALIANTENSKKGIACIDLKRVTSNLKLFAVKPGHYLLPPVIRPIDLLLTPVNAKASVAFALLRTVATADVQIILSSVRVTPRVDPLGPVSLQVIRRRRIVALLISGPVAPPMLGRLCA